MASPEILVVGQEDSEYVRRMLLGQTDGFRYIGLSWRPSTEELDNIPVPVGYWHREGPPLPHMMGYSDGSVSLGFDSYLFGSEPFIIRGQERSSHFVQFAEQYAQSLGNVTLNRIVNFIGPGSMFTAENRELHF